MRRLTQVLATIVTAAFIALLLQVSTSATLKYKKDTGKKCTFCHTEVPRPGDEDPKLNEDGKLFRKNGYRLTKEQEAKPDPADREP